MKDFNGEPILSVLKTMRSRFTGTPEYIICSSRIRADILGSNYVGHMISIKDDAETMVLGMRFAVVETTEKLLELR